MEANEKPAPVAAEPERAAQPARERAEEPAHELAAELLEVLRGEPHAHGGEEVLHVAAVELEAVGLADAVDHLHLQRNDRHRGEALRQQLERPVEDGVVEDHLSISAPVIVAA